MKIKPQHRKSGYSNKIAEQYVDLNAPIYLLSDELEPQQKYENNKPTGKLSLIKLGLDKKVSLLFKWNLQKHLNYQTTYLWFHLKV